VSTPANRTGTRLLEQRIGYIFKVPELLEQALTHKSYPLEILKEDSQSAHNERLEFLGDAVLQLAVTDELCRRLPSASAGHMSKPRASLVNASHLAQLASGLDLQHLLLIGQSLATDPTRYSKPGLLANAFEALLGAVYMDGGHEPADQVARQLLESSLAKAEASGEIVRDYKTALQEACMLRYKELPSYNVSMLSQDSEPIRYRAAVYVKGECAGTGEGGTKKAATKKAAQEAYRCMFKSTNIVDV